MCVGLPICPCSEIGKHVGQCAHVCVNVCAQGAQGMYIWWQVYLGGSFLMHVYFSLFYILMLSSIQICQHYKLYFYYDFWLKVIWCDCPLTLSQ